MSVARTVDARTSRKTSHDYGNVSAILPDHDGRVARVERNSEKKSASELSW